jgi:hypothetical protein
MGEEGESNMEGVKVLAMFNNFVAILASLLDSSIAFEWYECSCYSSFAILNTSPNFPIMVSRFNGQILKTFNLAFMVFFSRIATRPCPPMLLV